MMKMNKLSKIVSIAILIIAVLSISVSAYTNADVIDYVTRAHTVNGRTAQLDKAQRESLSKYLRDNPVSNSEADEIIAKLDKAKSLIDHSGATSLSNLSTSIKAEVVALIKEAGAIAKLDVEVDTVKETVTIKTRGGKTIIGATSYSQFNTNPASNSSNANSSTTSNSNKLVYTGNSFSIDMTKIGIAIVAIAIAGVVLKHKYAK